jgi:hypothetical protein
MFERIKAMDRRTLIPLLLAAVLGLLLFSNIVGGIRQAGWNEGFIAGLLTNGGENAKAVMPYLSQSGGYHGYAMHGWGGHGFGFIGGFFRFLFFGFLLMMFFKVLGFWRWRMHGGHPWRHHQHGPWGRHHGPWGDQQGQPYGQQPGHPQPEQGAPSTTSSSAEGHTPQPVSWVKV